jgi:hypothetical protein
LYRIFHPYEFAQIEEKLVVAMGLFYKVRHPHSLYSFLMTRMGAADVGARGQQFTPVQGSMRRAIEEKQFISISAPTSAGKSFSIRDYLVSDSGDAVVIVPSRALIAEYLASVRSIFRGEKGVMILPFVDRVFTDRTLRRIFVLTPERARDLFDLRAELNVTTFFFDEAQISEEPNRGPFFDVLVRRVRSGFPNAKLVFAHPFVENPEAQLEKHGLSSPASSFSMSYRQGAVGKVFLFRHTNGKDYFFSPFEKGEGHLLKNCEQFGGDFSEFAFGSGHSVLVYVTKASIYNGSFLNGFDEYIAAFPAVEDPAALETIEAVRAAVGADQKGHRSRMVDLLAKGVVIHHGSVPLEVRFILEEFVRSGFARICFATSTLVQGVNMPFDIVWLDSMRIIGESDEGRSLAFKNLIGRAGRSTHAEGFDFGYVFTNSPKTLAKRVSDVYRLSAKSIIDDENRQDSSADPELLESIREGTFNEALHVPQSKVERLSSPDVQAAVKEVLDIVFHGLTVRASVRSNRIARVRIRDRLKDIYEASLARALEYGERVVFEEAISLMLQVFGGQSFREIVGTRFARISRKADGRKGPAAFSQRANKLPDASLTRPFSLFDLGTPAASVNYDAVVFDTYDYLDEVISFCLSDTFLAAFNIYFKATSDERALRFGDLLRYGTDNKKHILLMRYGFLPDDIESLMPHVESIDEKKIVFRDSVREVDSRLQGVVAWYL